MTLASSENRPLKRPARAALAAALLVSGVPQALAGALVPESPAQFDEGLLIYPREHRGLDAEYASDLLTYAYPVHWECSFAARSRQLQLSAGSLSTFHLATFMRGHFTTHPEGGAGGSSSHPAAFYGALAAERFETFSRQLQSLMPELGLVVPVDGLSAEPRFFTFGQLTLPKQRVDAGLGLGVRNAPRDGIGLWDIEARVLFEDTLRNKHGAFDDHFSADREPITGETRLLWLPEGTGTGSAGSAPPCVIARVRGARAYRWNVPLSDESVQGNSADFALAFSLPLKSPPDPTQTDSSGHTHVWIEFRGERMQNQRTWTGLSGRVRNAAASERTGAQEFAPAGSAATTVEQFAQMQLAVWKDSRSTGSGGEAGLAWHRLRMERTHAGDDGNSGLSASQQNTWLPYLWLRAGVFEASQLALGLEWSFAYAEKAPFPRGSLRTQPSETATPTTADNGRVNVQWSSALNDALWIAVLGSWDLDETGMRRRFEGGMGQLRATF